MEQQPRHILVVEDEKQLLGLIRIFLEQSGYQVSSAQNSREAYELIDSIKNFDAAIVDLTLPRPDHTYQSGYEVSDYFHRSHPHAPVIAISGYLQPESSLPPGKTVFLSKPFSVPELISSLQKTLTE